MTWLELVGAFFLVYFLAVNSGYLALTALAFRNLRRYVDRLRSLDLMDLLDASGGLPITLIVPAFDEEAGIVESVRSLLALGYVDHEVVVVSDGSTDRTVERLVSAFAMVPAHRVPTASLPTAPIRAIYRSRRHPGLWLIDKENGGKADALNAGLNHCRSPLFCAMDADTMLEHDALTRVVRPFLEDARTVAAGGIVRIANGCEISGGLVSEVRLPRRLLPRLQVLEYLRAFLGARMGWDALGATLLISGAFGAFQRATVVDVGGFATDTVGEDMELVVRLHRHLRDAGKAYRIVFVPDPVAWTEAPERLRTLARQRDRWQRGLAQTLWRHRTMAFRRRYGLPGMVAYPFFVTFELLGPVVELAGYLLFVWAAVTKSLGLTYFVLFTGFAIVLGISLSLGALVLEELSFRRYPRGSDLAALAVLAIVDNLGYRQLTVLWRVRGLWRAVRGTGGWGRMERRGFGVGSTATPPRDDAGEAGPVDTGSAGMGSTSDTAIVVPLPTDGAVTDGRVGGPLQAGLGG